MKRGYKLLRPSLFCQEALSTQFKRTYISLGPNQSIFLLNNTALTECPYTSTFTAPLTLLSHFLVYSISLLLIVI